MQFDDGKRSQYEDESEFVRPHSRTGDYVIGKYSVRPRCALWRMFTINPTRDGIQSDKSLQTPPTLKTDTIWQHTLHSRTDLRSEFY